ncbi:MAG: hypothetical protein M9890_11470 [Thermomicrobiales bacterium]|nr:hypothetical protein [Thermomicrobiales bacterium]
MDFDTLIIITLGTIFFLIVIPHFHKPVVLMLQALFSLPFYPATIVSNALNRLCESTKTRIDHTVQGIQENYGKSEEHAVNSMWLVIEPLLHAMLFLILFTGDAILAMLRFAGLLNIPVHDLPTNRLDIIFGFIWTIAIFALGEIFLHPPTWLKVPEDWQRKFRIGLIVTIIVAAVTTVLLFVFAAMAISGESSQAMNISINAGVGFVLFVITGLTALSLKTALASAWIAILWGFILVARLASRLLALFATIIERLYWLVVRIVEIPIDLGRQFHNYLCKYHVLSTYLHLTEMRELDYSQYTLKGADEE